MMSLPRIVAVFAFATLSLSSLFSQQTSAKPQAQHPTGTMVLNFGPTESNPEGKAAAEKLLQALGGATEVNAVRSLRQTLIALRQGQKIDTEQTIVYPNKQAQTVTLPQGRVTMVVTPTTAFIARENQVQGLPPNQRAAFDATLKHDFINVLQHINDPKYVFVALGQEKVRGLEATIVDVEADGVPTRWWIGADGKLLQERYSDMAQGGGAMQTMIYLDWKNFGGLKYPTRYQMTQPGQPGMTMTLTAMEVNATVNPTVFEMPTQ
jgi:hypothetical protein